MTRPVEIGNLLADLPCARDGEQCENLVASGAVRIERIVSAGQATPDGEFYDQEWDEWVAVLQGSATLEIDGEAGELQMVGGDWVFLPAGCRHRVTATSANPACLWLAVHAPKK